MITDIIFELLCKHTQMYYISWKYNGTLNECKSIFRDEAHIVLHKLLNSQVKINSSEIQTKIKYLKVVK